MASEAQIQQYNDQGYFIADDAVVPEMLPTLTEATRRVADKVRSGEVVDTFDQIRTSGAGKNPVVIMGVMAPEFGEPIFAEYLTSEPVERYVHPLSGQRITPRLGDRICYSGEVLTNAGGIETLAQKNAMAAMRWRWKSSVATVKTCSSGIRRWWMIRVYGSYRAASVVTALTMSARY